MRKFIVANWKENPLTEREAISLFAKTDAAATRKKSDTRYPIPDTRVQVVICPPVAYLESLHEKFTALRVKHNLALGAQDVFWENKGAFTGGEGPSIIRSLGAQYIIVGHSERRKFFRETDAMVNKKVLATLAEGLTVILCVGEPLSVRKKGMAAAKNFIKKQLTKDLKRLYPMPHTSYPRLFIAYEPIWAIGKGKGDSPADASLMAEFIKKIIKRLYPIPHTPYPKILYGGSVNSSNVANYVSQKNIDGALVGGASLDAREFGKMIAKVERGM